MLFVPEDKTKYVCSDSNSAPCFRRGTHNKLAKEMGLCLDKMEDKTSEFFYKGKGESLKNFINKQFDKLTKPARITTTENESPAGQINQGIQQ